MRMQTLTRCALRTYSIALHGVWRCTPSTWYDTSELNWPAKRPSVRPVSRGKSAVEYIGISRNISYFLLSFLHFYRMISLVNKILSISAMSENVHTIAQVSPACMSTAPVNVLGLLIRNQQAKTFGRKWPGWVWWLEHRLVNCIARGLSYTNSLKCCGAVIKNPDRDISRLDVRINYITASTSCRSSDQSNRLRPLYIRYRYLQPPFVTFISLMSVILIEDVYSEVSKACKTVTRNFGGCSFRLLPCFLSPPFLPSFLPFFLPSTLPSLFSVSKWSLKSS